MNKKSLFPASRFQKTACILVIALLFGFVLLSGCLDRLPFISGGSPSPLRTAGDTGPLSVYFLDVGQGDSALVCFHNTTILIDAGELGGGDRVVEDLHALGIRKIDLLVATHAHSDHIGGMKAVLDEFSVGKVLDAGMAHPSPLYESFLTTVAAKHIPFTTVHRGMTLEPEPGLRILVLSPPKHPSDSDLNENSIVLRISYGTVDFLFTGDTGSKTETDLITSGYPVDAEILKVGHHGSMHSSSAPFIARVHPEIAVISSGRDNPFGHPHRQSLDTLKTAGAEIFRTDTDGTVRVDSDGITYSVLTGNNRVFSRTMTSTVQTTATKVPDSATVFPDIPASPENTTLPVPDYTFPQFGNTSGVRISSWQFNAPGDDRENLNGEWICVANSGNDPVLLNGWTLADRTGSRIYVFPAFILMPSSSVRIYTGSGSMNDTSLFMGRTVPVWGNTGDTAVLADEWGSIIDQVSGSRGS